MRFRRSIGLRNEEGATMVEFTLIAVLLIMVLLGVVEMGRMILVYTTMAHAARAGVRYATVHGSDRPTSGVTAYYEQSGPGNPCACPAIVDVVQNYADAGLITGTDVQVTVAYPGSSTASSPANAPGKPVTVSVSYTYSPLVGYFSSLLNVNLSSSSEGIIAF